MASKDDYDAMVARRQQELANQDPSQLLSQLQGNYEGNSSFDPYSPAMVAGHALTQHEMFPTTNPIGPERLQAIMEIARQFEMERARQQAIQQIDAGNRPGLMAILAEKLGGAF